MASLAVELYESGVGQDNDVIAKKQSEISWKLDFWGPRKDDMEKIKAAAASMIEFNGVGGFKSEQERTLIIEAIAANHGKLLERDFDKINKKTNESHDHGESTEQEWQPVF